MSARYNKVFGAPATGPAYVANVDVTSLHTLPDGPVREHCQNIFFQCPWIDNYCPELYCDCTANLIRNFVLSAAQVQNHGDNLFIGIVALSPYSYNYGLRELIQTARENGYNFNGADPFTIKKILSFGYKHQARTNATRMHEYIIRYHVTLVFTKVETPSISDFADELSDNFSKLTVRDTKKLDSA